VPQAGYEPPREIGKTPEARDLREGQGKREPRVAGSQETW